MKKRFSEEQIIGFLKEADSGVPVKDLCRRHGFSDPSYSLWRSECGGRDVSDAKRLKALESENARLEKLTPGTHRWLSSPGAVGLRSDNGREPRGKAMLTWAHRNGAALRQTASGKWARDTSVESCNGRLPQRSLVRQPGACPGRDQRPAPRIPRIRRGTTEASTWRADARHPCKASGRQGLH